VGVEKFYIYDNESTDNIKEILSPYINTGEVVYCMAHSNGTSADLPQFQSYNDAIQKFRNKTKWLAIIDIDEFIVPVKKSTIPEVLILLQKKLGKIYSLGIHWIEYGYSGHYNKPNGFVIESFTKNAGLRLDNTVSPPGVIVKSIVNPRTVTEAKCHTHFHFFDKIPKAINENGIEFFGSNVTDLSKAGIDYIRINHYFTRSYEEYKNKLMRNQSRLSDYRIKTIPKFIPDFLSQYEDKIMEKYIPLLKNTINQ
jgi:predicted MPP superfamily phosphohydrolase